MQSLENQKLHEQAELPFPNYQNPLSEPIRFRPYFDGGNVSAHSSFGESVFREDSSLQGFSVELEPTTSLCEVVSTSESDEVNCF